MTARWRDQARCAGQGINTLFPEDRNAPGTAEYQAEVEQLRTDYCWKCPVRAECLADGMVEEYGIWGGLTPEDRKKVTQLLCSCGRAIDPKGMSSPGGRHFCPDCRPLAWCQ